MKRIIYSLSFAMLLTSCGKEETTPTPLSIVQPSKISGNWIAVKATVQQYSSNNMPVGNPKKEDMTGSTFTFSGNTGYSEKYQNPDTVITTSGSYSLAGDLLNVQPGKWVGIKPDLYIVDTLNAHRLVFHLKAGMPNAFGGVTFITYTAKR